jgi:hypothetical protein
MIMLSQQVAPSELELSAVREAPPGLAGAAGPGGGCSRDGCAHARHAVRELVVDTGGCAAAGRVAAVVAVCHAPDAPCGGEAGRGAGLNTGGVLDAAALAVRLGECYLARRRGLGPRQRRRAWVRSLEVCADGQAAPAAEFAAEARVADSRPSPLSLCGHLTAFECRIGGLRVRCAIEHEPGTIQRAAGTFAGVEELLGDPGPGFFADGYRRRLWDVGELHVEAGARTACALVAAGGPGGPQAGGPPGAARPTGLEAGLEAEYRPGLSALDGLAVSARLARELSHGWDGAPQQAAAGAWIRRACAALASPYQPAVQPFAASVRTTRFGAFDGAGRWLSADLEAQMLALRCSLSLARTPPSA